jgi:hypothetical protein
MKTKQVLFTIFGVCALFMGAFAKENFASSNDKYIKHSLVIAVAKESVAAKVMAPAIILEGFSAATSLDAELAKVIEAPAVEANTVLAKSKAEALNMSGLKPMMMDQEILNADVVKQLEKFQSETKALEQVVKIDKQITEVK